MAAATELSQSKLAYLEWRADPDRLGTKKDAAAACGVSYETIRRWEREPWFTEALNRRLAEMNVTPDRVQAIVDALWTAAKGGDVQAAKEYMVIVRDLMPSRPKMEDRAVEEMTDEELEAAWRDGL